MNFYQSTYPKLAVAFCLMLMSMSCGHHKNSNRALPIKTQSNSFEISFGESKVEGLAFSSEENLDVTHIKVPKKGLEITCTTDRDTLRFWLNPKDTFQTKVTSIKEDKTIQMLVIGIDSIHKKVDLDFSNIESPAPFRFNYLHANPEYLNKLKEDFNLEDVVKGANSDIEKLLRVTSWTNRQWAHDGQNMPSKPNAHTILQEVKEGKKYRCVEYSIVIAEVMEALGYPSRVLGLKMKECETLLSGAGHAVAEVFLPELNKWVFADGQFDVVPFLNNEPLNAVELQKAITTDHNALEIVTKKAETSKNQYTNWVYPYLFYFDYKVDFVDPENVKKGLMLVPKNSKEPTIFQKKWGIGNCAYTTSLQDFYKSP